MLGGWPRCLKINHAFKTKLQCLCARVQSIVSVHYIRKILPPENPKNHDCTRYGICHKWHKWPLCKICLARLNFQELTHKNTFSVKYKTIIWSQTLKTWFGFRQLFENV